MSPHRAGPDDCVLRGSIVFEHATIVTTCDPSQRDRTRSCVSRRLLARVNESISKGN